MNTVSLVAASFSTLSVYAPTTHRASGINYHLPDRASEFLLFS
jgi:hypothetical protein